MPLRHGTPGLEVLLWSPFLMMQSFAIIAMPHVAIHCKSIFHAGDEQQFFLFLWSSHVLAGVNWGCEILGVGLGVQVPRLMPAKVWQWAHFEGRLNSKIKTI